MNEEPSESDLIGRFRRGDEEAFRVLLDRCATDLEALADRRLAAALRRRVSVADVLQEARIAAYAHRDELEDRGPGSFRNWLLGIVDRRVLRLVKRHTEAARRTIHAEISRTFMPDSGQLPGNEFSPSQIAIGSEVKDAIRQAMAELPEAHREVLRLTLAERLTHREVAESMGRSVEAVKKLRARALQAFTRVFIQKKGRISHE